MESMDLARGFGELMGSYMEMMACDMGVYNGEELDPNIEFTTVRN